jgi:hypothetical protein
VGDAPVIGVYDVFARWQGGHRLLVAGKASGYEVVSVHPGTLYLAAVSALKFVTRCCRNAPDDVEREFLHQMQLPFVDWQGDMLQ